MDTSRPQNPDGLFTLAEWRRLVVSLKLSPRQAEILQLLFSGKCDKQIALHLAISGPTVRTHLQRMYSRFGVSDRTSLVIQVFRKFRECSA